MEEARHSYLMFGMADRRDGRLLSPPYEIHDGLKRAVPVCCMCQRKPPSGIVDIVEGDRIPGWWDKPAPAGTIVQMCDPCAADYIASVCFG